MKGKEWTWMANKGELWKEYNFKTGYLRWSPPKNKNISATQLGFLFGIPLRRLLLCRRGVFFNRGLFYWFSRLAATGFPRVRSAKYWCDFAPVWTISANTLTDFRGPLFLHNCPWIPGARGRKSKPTNRSVSLTRCFETAPRDLAKWLSGHS